VECLEGDCRSCGTAAWRVHRHGANGNVHSKSIVSRLFDYLMKSIHTVGVVGAGTMGTAIAQKFAHEGFPVVLCDRTRELAEMGISVISTTLDEGVAKALFTAETARATLSRIRGTARLTDLAMCDLVVETIFEDFAAKSKVLAQLGGIVGADVIVATNTSSFLITDLARNIVRPERFLGLHFFYHAAKNRLVEIIPGVRTSPETVRVAEQVCVMTGKNAIVCRDRHGFAMNRFFVPWLNEAVRLYEEGIAPIATIDAVCRDAFGIGMGPFALMNRTGVSIAYRSQRTLETLGGFYTVAEALREQAEANALWVVGGGLLAITTPDVVHAITERMFGAVFLVCGQILDEGVCSPEALERGAKVGLRWSNGPIAIMRVQGRAAVERLVRVMTTRHQMPFPCGIKRAFEEPEHVVELGGV
jgi:enoyl-CoA hydratase/3-hydroxyacyl-CoA dehydrogenase